MNGSEGEWGEEGNGTLDQWGALQCEADWGVTEEERLVRFIVHGVLLNAVGCGGLAGSVLAALVLTRPAMRCSSSVLLLALAGADAALLACSLLLFGVSGLYPYTGLCRAYYTRIVPRLTPWLYPLANAAQTLSVYLTLALTVERWLAVCRPFRARVLCTEARARLLVLGTAGFALAYNAPKFMEAEVYQLGAGDEAVYCVRANPAVRTELYVAVYIHWTYLLVMYAVPFSALAVLNARIVRQVRAAQRERARLSRGQRRELGLATVLLAVVLVFFLCNLLPLVTNACEVFGGDSFETLDPLVKTSNLLVTINSSVNFLIYVTLGAKFKRVFLKMCGCGVGGALEGSTRRWRGRGATDGAVGGRGGSPDDSFASCEHVSLRATSLRGVRLPARRSPRPALHRTSTDVTQLPALPDDVTQLPALPDDVTQLPALPDDHEHTNGHAHEQL